LLGLRGLNLQRIAWTFAFVVVFASWSAFANTFLAVMNWPHFTDAFVAFFYFDIGYFFPPMLAMTVADNLPLRGRARFAALTLALVAGVAASLPTTCALTPIWTQCDAFPSWQSFITGWQDALIGAVTIGVIAIAYFTLRRDRELAAALHAAELNCIAIERRTLESDLQTMQARVDPEFLIGTLGDAARVCDVDPRSSDNMLRDLASYLRAALPDMGSSSSLRREIELVQSWLAIVQIRTGGHMNFVVDADPDLDDVKFPPMTMLPLLASFVPGDTQTLASAETRIAASRFGPLLRVRFVGGNIGGRTPTNNDEPLRTARERLKALYGDNASLEIETAGIGESEIVLHIPFEHRDVPQPATNG
jgi:hypothetical protein